MQTSLEKVPAFIAQLEGATGGDPDAFELAIKTALQFGAPLLDQLLPDDPAVLDEYLENIARQVLSMRSDGAHRLLVVPMEQVVDAEVSEEPRELPAG
jgi:hypothetical protein